jgi:hypothetical protein
MGRHSDALCLPYHSSRNRAGWLESGLTFIIPTWIFRYLGSDDNGRKHPLERNHAPEGDMALPNTL